MNNEKIYVPGTYAKAKKFDNGGEILRLSLNAEKVIDFINKNKNDKGYITFNIGPKRTPDEKSTHYVALDTWKPSTAPANGSAQPFKVATPVKTPNQPVKPAQTEDDSNGYF